MAQTDLEKRVERIERELDIEESEDSGMDVDLGRLVERLEGKGATVLEVEGRSTFSSYIDIEVEMPGESEESGHRFSLAPIDESDNFRFGGSIWGPYGTDDRMRIFLKDL